MACNLGISATRSQPSISISVNIMCSLALSISTVPPGNDCVSVNTVGHILSEASFMVAEEADKVEVAPLATLGLGGFE